MNLSRFNELMALKKRPWQEPAEWREFLSFACGYFRTREIHRPLVVELGVASNRQKRFYEELMNAEHIGIDISGKRAPDIMGDTHSPETLAALKEKLKGRLIDLLFIDAGHLFKDVVEDAITYGVLVKHLIVLHDICHVKAGVEVKRLWKEITDNNVDYIKIAFNTLPNHMGLGVYMRKEIEE